MSELKKRIREKAVGVINDEIERDKKDPDFEPDAIFINDLEKILDEVAQEFPCRKCPRVGTDDDNCVNYCCGLYGEFFKWFKKWFGGVEEK